MSNTLYPIFRFFRVDPLVAARQYTEEYGSAALVCMTPTEIAEAFFLQGALWASSKAEENEQYLIDFTLGGK